MFTQMSLNRPKVPIQQIRREFNEKLKPYGMVTFDLTDETLPSLGKTIKDCLLRRLKLLVFCSMGDDTLLELCQIPEVRRVFYRACLDHGLLGYLYYQQWRWDSDFNDNIKTVTNVCLGKYTGNDGKDFFTEVEGSKVKSLNDASTEKFHKLYGHYIPRESIVRVGSCHQPL